MQNIILTEASTQPFVTESYFSSSVISDEEKNVIV